MSVSNEWEKYKKDIAQAISTLETSQRTYNELRAKCMCEETEHKTHYTSGCFYNRAITEEWDECVVCHKVYNKIGK